MCLFPIFVFTLAGIAAQEPPLVPLNISEDAISVSGFSSGGSMAHQFHVAYSSLFMGAAVMAGVPYSCVDTTGFMECSGSPKVINVTTLHMVTEEYAGNGDIDELSNMADDQIWTYTGALDSSVLPEAAIKIAEFYDVYNDKVMLENTLQAEHVLPTDISSNGLCNVTERPYIADCEYDSPFVFLNYIYGGSLVPPNRDNVTENLPGEIRQFDQTEFVEGISGVHGIGDTGYIYTPSNCLSGDIECRLHIALHGCDMNRDIIGDEFPTQTGYNEVAELNNIVIIYPQTGVILQNPVGCWDIWGYTGDNYVTKAAVQMTTLVQMIDRVAGTLTTPTKP